MKQLPKKLPKKPANKKAAPKNPPYEVSTEDYLKARGWALRESWTQYDYKDPITGHYYEPDDAACIEKDRESWSEEKISGLKLLYKLKEFREEFYPIIDTLRNEVAELKAKKKRWFW